MIESVECNGGEAGFRNIPLFPRFGKRDRETERERERKRETTPEIKFIERSRLAIALVRIAAIKRHETARREVTVLVLRQIAEAVQRGFLSRLAEDSLCNELHGRV